MTVDADDIVCVASGSLIQVESWHELLGAAGIESRIVGDNLAGGLGTALPNSVELWVHRADAKAAEATIGGASEHRHQEPEPPHGHPMSDANTDKSRGPQHGAPPRRPLPSR